MKYLKPEPSCSDIGIIVDKKALDYTYTKTKDLSLGQNSLERY